MNAEATAVKPASPAIARRGRCSTPADNVRVKASSAPVRISAPERMNIAPMVIGAGLANTASRSPTGRMPIAISSAAPQMATTSGGWISRTKAANMVTTTPSVTRAGQGSGQRSARIDIGAGPLLCGAPAPGDGLSFALPAQCGLGGGDAPDLAMRAALPFSGTARCAVPPPNLPPDSFNAGGGGGHSSCRRTEISPLPLFGACLRAAPPSQPPPRGGRRAKRRRVAIAAAAQRINPPWPGCLRVRRGEYFPPAGKTAQPAGSRGIARRCFTNSGIPPGESACTAGRYGQTSGERPHGASHTSRRARARPRPDAGWEATHDGGTRHMVLTGKR